ncbi:MAG: M48 family peptidase, partial [bacterium]
MYSLAFSVLFVSFLLLTLAVRFWLASRHIRHILVHRSAVPTEFAGKIPLAAHQKAADYTIAKTKFGIIVLLVHAAVLICFTLLGGLQWLSAAVFNFTDIGMTYQIGLILAFALISSLIDLPFDYYKQFVLEQRFGFNKMSVRLFFVDMLKNTLLGAAIGLPLLWVVLLLMEKSGSLWWLYAWLVWSGFQLLMLVLYPTV